MKRTVMGSLKEKRRVAGGSREGEGGEFSLMLRPLYPLCALRVTPFFPPCTLPLTYCHAVCVFFIYRSPSVSVLLLGFWSVHAFTLTLPCCVCSDIPQKTPTFVSLVYISLRAKG